MSAGCLGPGHALCQPVRRFGRLGCSAGFKGRASLWGQGAAARLNAVMIPANFFWQVNFNMPAFGGFGAFSSGMQGFEAPMTRAEATPQHRRSSG